MRLAIKILKKNYYTVAECTNSNRCQLLAQRKSQKMYFDRGAMSLLPVKTGDAVRMKTKNGWKSVTVTKLDYTPRSVIVTSNGTLYMIYRRNRRDVIKTMEVNKGTITTPKGDREITKGIGSERTIKKTPEVVRTRSGRTIRAPRQDDFVYY